MRIGRRCGACLILIVIAVTPAAVAQQPVAFDFDTGVPALVPGTAAPLSQTAGGLTAAFEGTPGSIFAVQNGASVNWKVTPFSGNFLTKGDLSRSALLIRLSEPAGSISLQFATADFEIEVPSSIKLTAWMDATTNSPVGEVSVRGAYRQGDTFPSGTLTFHSGSAPFNLVRLEMPFESPRGTTVFHVDNIGVTRFAAAASVSAASYIPDGPLAAGAIASAFGQGLAAGTEHATSLPLPVTLAGASVTIRDSAGAELPAALYFASPGQINYRVPVDAAVGRATVTVRNGTAVTGTGGIDILRVAPGIFTANLNGRGVPAGAAVRVATDGTQTTLPVAQCGSTGCAAVPLDLGPAGTQTILTLYGTGIAGRTSLAAVSATIAGVAADVHFAGEQGQYAGLDQVNIAIPRTLAGRGEAEVVVIVDGRAANPVTIQIR